MTTIDGTPETIAETLRSAAAWLRLTADRLDTGQLTEPVDMAQLGRFGSQDIPERIAQLEADILRT